MTFVALAVEGTDTAPSTDAPGNEPHTPSDRATTFQAVKGEPEHYSGETLLVSAYAIVWVVMLAWVALVWRKQQSVNARLDDLEKEVARAVAARSAHEPGGAARPAP